MPMFETSRNTTDFRLLKWRRSGRLYRFNVNFFGSLFRTQSAEMVEVTAP